jgi:hypothetical protein
MSFNQENIDDLVDNIKKNIVITKKKSEPRREKIIKVNPKIKNKKNFKINSQPRTLRM